MTPRILLIEGCDFESFPAGGQLTTVAHMMAAFPTVFGLVGITTGNDPVGEWTQKVISGVSYPFFAAGRREVSAARPFIPLRLAFYRDLKRFRRRIVSIGARHAFAIAPETIMAIADWGWESFAYKFSGTENPLTRPRYAWARPFADLFDRLHLGATRQADVLFAAADETAIEELVARGRGLVDRFRIVQSPTSFDSRYFYPLDQRTARNALNIFESGPVFVVSGRISEVKGWRLLVESFARVRSVAPDACLYFVGDGEDRSKLEAQIQQLNLGDSVRIAGFQPPRAVGTYLNAADVVLLGSTREGWPTAVVEALACGKAVVSTRVSGIHDLVVPGLNGFLVDHRDPSSFGAAMIQAANLTGYREVSLRTAQRHNLDSMAKRLREGWPPLNHSDPMQASAIGHV